MNNLNNILIEYIENNKIKNNIEYTETIETIEELLKEIKEEYNNLK